MRAKGDAMEQDTLWTDWEDQDLDAHLKAKVEALLAGPTGSRRYLPLLGAGPAHRRWNAIPLRAGYHATAVHHTVCIHGAWPGSHPQGHVTKREAS